MVWFLLFWMADPKQHVHFLLSNTTNSWECLSVTLNILNFLWNKKNHQIYWTEKWSVHYSTLPIKVWGILHVRWLLWASIEEIWTDLIDWLIDLIIFSCVCLCCSSPSESSGVSDEHSDKRAHLRRDHPRRHERLLLHLLPHPSQRQEHSC